MSKTPPFDPPLLRAARLRFPLLGSPLVRSRRTVGGVLIALAVLLAGWILLLGAQTRGQVEVRNWGVVWIGMDLAQVAGLAVSGYLLLRRSRLVSLSAAAAATLLLLDAWFDVMTAAGGAEWYTALAMALLVELPAACGLALLSRIALDW
ncbi:hypothetical protein CFP65_3414 [Kitasatospora sp. MMS16-BH015]|nr:hypothetical protein [Kitasatospora sp. MMS16-BH015]AUG78210.1 hypothetical protein CFP65_3414 [Kitasatospora sp. MMS16-BH015]